MNPHFTEVISDLLDFIDKENIRISYTTDDDGLHVSRDQESFYLGYILDFEDIISARKRLYDRVD